MTFIREHKKGLSLGSLTLALAGIFGVANLSKEIKTGCETYRGYTYDDGSKIHIFDEKKKEERGIDGPNYALTTKIKDLHSKLEMDHGSYKLTIREPVIPLLGDRLVGIKKCE